MHLPARLHLDETDAPLVIGDEIDRAFRPGRSHHGVAVFAEAGGSQPLQPRAFGVAVHPPSSSSSITSSPSTSSKSSSSISSNASPLAWPFPPRWTWPSGVRARPYRVRAIRPACSSHGSITCSMVAKSRPLDAASDLGPTGPLL